MGGQLKSAEATLQKMMLMLMPHRSQSLKHKAKGGDVVIGTLNEAGNRKALHLVMSTLSSVDTLRNNPIGQHPLQYPSEVDKALSAAALRLRTNSVKKRRQAQSLKVQAPESSTSNSSSSGSSSESSSDEPANAEP